MASNGSLDPHTQTHKVQPPLQEQDNYARFESEPDTPLPSSLNPAPASPASPSTDNVPADKVTPQHPANPIDTTLSHVNNSDASLDPSSNGSGAGEAEAAGTGTEAGTVSASGLAPAPAPESRSSSPSALYPSYAANLHELSEASVQYFPTFSASPAKLNHLQNLMSSLHKIMNDQSFAMGDLRTQLDEIQDVLKRVSPQKDSLTIEERQILQNAQMMKDLAEEVVSSSPSSKPWTNIDKQDLLTENTQSHSPLALTMPTPGGHLGEPTDAPPPTATTPPPGLIFQPGYLRHRSSTTSFASSAASDRQYTQDSEEHPSRPSSVASSRRHRTKKSLRQLEPLNSDKRSHVEQESNAAYDRICSLLTELITDASTAVSTAPDGSQQKNHMGFPHIAPILPSDSESSSGSSSDDEGVEDTNSIGGENEEATERKEIDDPFLRRLQGPEIVPSRNEKEVEVELEPVDRYRTGIRPRLDKSKRHSSLFMELQSTPVVQDATPNGEYGRRRQFSDVSYMDRDVVKERIMRRPRHSISSVSVSSARSSRPSSMYLSVSKSSENAEGQDSCDSPPDSPLVGRRLRHRDSISSLRSEPVMRKKTMDNEVQLASKRVDADLDRTVETIDGLTRDLVAVATHQNLMQIRLQKTLQFQKEQIQQIERAHSSKEVASSAGEQTLSTGSGTTDPSATIELLPEQQNHLADLSMSLKQVAVSVGKVIASSAKNTRNQITAGEHYSGELTHAMDQDQATNGFSRGDFSRYFQELEKIAALGSKFGFGKGEEDGVERDTLFDLQEQKGQQESGSSSFKNLSKNQSCRNSTATLVGDELGFSLEEQFKAAPLHFDDHDTDLVQDKAVANTRPRSDSSSVAPPELEDFAAQCRLLTKALVLPFIQLTHHAMTSQDSVLALNPRSDQDLNSTLKIVEELESSQEVLSPNPSSPVSGSRSPRSNRSSGSTSPITSAPRSRRESSSSSSLSSAVPQWTSAISSGGRDLDSMLKGHGDLSSDAVVKAKAFFSTGLYLLHLLYWTVLFVVGTVVLDPWLAENAGQQVVRIVDQVRDVIGKDDHSLRRHRLHHHHHQQQQQQQQQQPNWRRVHGPMESRRRLGMLQSAAAWAVSPRQSDVDVRRNSM